MIRVFGVRNVYYDILSICWLGGFNLIFSFFIIYGRVICYWMDVEDKRKQWFKGSIIIFDIYIGEKFFLRIEKTSLLFVYIFVVRRLLSVGLQERLCEQRRAFVMRVGREEFVGGQFFIVFSVGVGVWNTVCVRFGAVLLRGFGDYFFLKFFMLKGNLVKLFLWKFCFWFLIFIDVIIFRVILLGCVLV